MIHPTAIVDSRAKIGANVEIGPFAVIRGDVEIGAGCRIEAHAVVGNNFGKVILGERNQVFPGAVIGDVPQDVTYKGEPTRLEVGSDNLFRECCTVNTGTVKGGGVTRIGSHGMYMAYVHVAHDCQFGDRVIVANSCNFAGHVVVEDSVRIGGACSFAQFLKIGRFAYIGGGALVNKDVLPCTIAQGSYAVSRATNKIGLERAGFSKDEIESVHRAVRFLLMGDRTIEEALMLIAQECAQTPLVEHLVRFVKSSEKGIAR